MSRPTTLRRSLAASLAAVVLASAGAAPALAQEDSLPDPNQPKSSQTSTPAKSSQGSGLPTTGVETSWLVMAGVALLAGGVAIRPAARLRRRYRTDTWHDLVRSGS